MAQAQWTASGLAATILRLMVDSLGLDMALRFLQLNKGVLRDILWRPGAFTLLHFAVLLTSWNLGNTITHAPNIHSVGFNDRLSPYDETPTTLALYSSWTFAQWQASLREANVDFLEFVESEMQQHPARDRGWTTASLLTLFLQDDFESSSRPPGSIYCADCEDYLIGNFGNQILLQPYWQQVLYTNYMMPSGSDRLQSILEAKHASSSIGIYFQRAYRHVDARNTSSIRNNIPKRRRFNEDPRPYTWDDVLCMTCWQDYKILGKRYVLRGFWEGVPSGDASSDDEFSPFAIHT